MLKKTIMAICLLTSFATSTFAEETKPDMQVNIISEQDKVFGEKIRSFSLKKGIFVTVVSGWSTVYQKTADIVKEKLISQGIKVVDKPEDAEIGIQIVPLEFEMSEVESSIDAGINKEHLFSVIGSAIFTGGISLLGETWHHKGQNARVAIAASFYVNPKISSSGKLSGDSAFGSTSTIIYNANQEGAQVSTAVFVAYVDKLIENHFIIEPKAAEPVKTAEAAIPSTTSSNQ